MPNVFSNAPEDDDEDQAPGVRVAGALTGGDDEDEDPDKTPYVEPPRGVVDDSAQSYLSPAGADEGDEEPEPQQPGSADTQAYMKPIPPPTLAQPAAFADHSADTAAMTAQKQRESQENVKPSVGRKILAALSAGAAGFGTRNPEVGARIGQQIMNGPRADAEARWATQEAPIQAKLNADQAADAAVTRGNANIEQQNRLAEQNYRNQSLSQQNAARAADYAAQAESRKNAIVSFTPGDPANPYAGGTGTTADGRTVKGVPPPDKWLANWEKNPDNVAAAHAQAGVKTLKALEAAGVKLTPEQRAIVASGGKITPSSHTSISIRENPDGSAVTPQPRAGEMGPGEIIAKNMEDKQAYIDSLKRLDKDVTDTDANGNTTVIQPKGTLIDKNNNPVTPQEFNDRIEKFRADLNANPVMRKSGTMVDEHGNTVNNRFSRNPQQAAPQQQTPPPSGMKVSLSQARLLPINKGKSDDQIRADIAAHGHQVAP